MHTETWRTGTIRAIRVVVALASTWSVVVIFASLRLVNVHPFERTDADLRVFVCEQAASSSWMVVCALAIGAVAWLRWARARKWDHGACVFLVVVAMLAARYADMACEFMGGA